ncbi:MAG: sodium/proline symporter [Acidobacteriota bacterium]|nr:sodium/proline symporter [Acidobacteriota bacterium]
MPILDRPLIVIAAVLYLGICIGLGIWSLRRTRNAHDFWVAGQALGVVVTGIATMAAAFSGFVFVGGPGLTYRIGLSSLFINVSIGFTAGLLGWTVAKRLRLLAEVRDVYTIPDAVLCRYRSRLASGAAAVAVLIGTVGYLGTQLLALGVVMKAALGIESALLAVTLGTAVILFYSTAGGMVAGIWTDVFQGALMLLAAVGVFFYALDAGGGFGEIARSISSSERFGRQFLEPFGETPVLMPLGFFFVFGIGVLGQPHMLHKFFMLRDPRRLKWLPLILGGSQVICLLIWLGLGLAVPALVAQGKLPPLEKPDDAAPLFLLNFAPDLLAGLAVAAILAAIMSTADSFTNLGAAALVRDLPKALGRQVRNELLWGRIATVGVTLAAAVTAYLYNDLIALLGTFSFGTFGAALAPALAVGLNWKRVTAAAATASIITGTVLNLVLELKLIPLPPGALPTAVSLAASFVVLLLVSWWSAGEEIDEDVLAVMEA